MVRKPRCSKRQNCILRAASSAVAWRWIDSPFSAAAQAIVGNQLTLMKTAVTAFAYITCFICLPNGQLSLVHTPVIAFPFTTL